MINTTLSCTPPIVQLAGTAALKRDRKERDDSMLKFREKVVLLTEGLNRIAGFRALDPTATFYVFPNVARVCNELGITSHGLALYMLQGAETLRDRVPRRRMLRPSRRRLPALQLRRAERSAQEGAAVHSDSYLEARPSRVLARQESAVPPRAPVSDRLIGLVATRRVAIDDLTAGSNPQPLVRAHDRPATRSAALGCPRGRRTRTSGSAGRDSAAAPPSTIACRPSGR